MLEYVLTVTTPDGSETRETFGAIHHLRRRAVALVREASYPSDIGGSNARISALGQARDLLDSGGASIRFPDGSSLTASRRWPDPESAGENA